MITSAGNEDLLAGFDASELLPSTSIVPYFEPKCQYSGMLEVIAIKLIKQAVSKNKGLLAPIVSMVIEYTITFDRWTSLPEHVDPTEEGVVFMPIKFHMPGYQPTKDERDAFEASLARGEEALGPWYAFMEMPLQPDPRAQNRLAPLGRYAADPGMTDTEGKPIKGLHPNWGALVDYAIREDMPGFPVVARPSNGYLNPQCIDRGTFEAKILRDAAAARDAKLAEEGFSETALGANGYAANRTDSLPTDDEMPWENPSGAGV